MFVFLQKNINRDRDGRDTDEIATGFVKWHRHGKHHLHGNRIDGRLGPYNLFPFFCQPVPAGCQIAMHHRHGLERWKNGVYAVFEGGELPEYEIRVLVFQSPVYRDNI